jgi:hypothetical protein
MSLVLLPRIAPSTAQDLGFVLAAQAKEGMLSVSSSRAGATEPKIKRAVAAVAGRCAPEQH